MICPSKKCRIEIDDDSKFCDQCGSEILICSQCGMPGTGKFCAKDRGRMDSRRNISSAPESAPLAENAVNPPAPANPDQEVPVQRKDSRGPTARPDNGLNSAISELVIIHSSGLELKIRNNDIIGRSEGPHSEHLGNYEYMSRKHALIYTRSGSWYIKDMGATNRSKVNETLLQSGKEYNIKKDDRIMLADQEFIVK